MKIPKLRPTEYENLQVKSVAQTLADFQLKGPVKEVCETIRVLKTDGEDSSAFLKTEYLFSEKGKLISYLEDSASTLLQAYDQVNQIINTYDTTGEVLFETINRTTRWQKSKTVILFNKQGFRESEVYTCYDCGHGMSRSDPSYDSIFDYTLNYQWSPNFDSVSLKYHYVNPQSPYQRKQDITRSFVPEIKGKKNIQNGELKMSEIRTFNQWYRIFEEDIKYDKHHRICEWTIWDHEVKNSANVHRRDVYSYNENGELIGVKHFSTWGDSNFELDFQIEINYITYDSYNNWTEKEVKVVSGENHSMFRNEHASYRYSREIEYY